MAIQRSAVPVILGRGPLPLALGLAVTCPLLRTMPLALPAGPGLARFPQIDDIAQGVTLRFHGAGRYRRICTRAGQTIAYPIRGCGVLRPVFLAVRGLAK